MPTKEEILRFLKNPKQELAERFTVRWVGLFGSYLHGEAGDESDVDILVDLAQPTFDNYMDLKFFLEDYLSRPVDLVLADSAKPRLKPIITREVSYEKGDVGVKTTYCMY
jgi:hypothetical protein